MKIERRKCREIKIGDVKIGRGNPIAVQSMVKTFTSDLSATLREIRELEASGCQLVRVAVRDNRDAANLKEIKKGIHIPLIADIHFAKKLAIKAIESGVDKIRLNPGNIYKKDEVREIARAARQACIPIRIGVNSGSIIPKGQRILQCSQKAYSKKLTKIMVDSILDYIKLLEGAGFHDIVISVKSSDVYTTIKANQEIARLSSYPLHLGITATGFGLAGIIKSALVVGGLLSEGIGDTIRISLTDRAAKEVEVAFCILEALGLSEKRAEIISCPTCGRCEVDLVKMVKELDRKLRKSTDKNYRAPLKVAVMGCLVNGPGEARAADLGIAFGKKEGLLFRKGKSIKKVPFQNCVDTLLQEIDKSKQPSV